MISDLVRPVRLFGPGSTSPIANELLPDNRRTMLRPFDDGTSTVRSVVSAVMRLPAERVSLELASAINGYSGQFPGLHDALQHNFDMVAGSRLDSSLFQQLTAPQMALIGSYFTKQYTFERSLCNPSVVIHPDQAGSKDGKTRLLFSFRAVGEEFSSVVFRTATASNDGAVYMDRSSASGVYPKAFPASDTGCQIAFSVDVPMSERVIVPSMPEVEDNGIEDLRLVRFLSEESPPFFFGTYTAFQRPNITSRLLGTFDFRHFSMDHLKGQMAANKGLAIFPRKLTVGGQEKYAAIARPDGRNLYLSLTDNILEWENGTLLMEPQYSWELVKIGNCGSPIETPEGWLMFTHGIGPLKRYSISAVLLSDQGDRVIGRLKEPLISPEGDATKGDVPNAVYSCGSTLLPNGMIILPWAEADSRCRISIIYLNDLMEAFK